MGHDLHFLERLERLRDDQVSEALSFYRDHELVKIVLQELKLPEAIDRVAISLDDPVEGPFIIVHRSGRFITCLGEGMHVGDRYVVTKERFDSVTRHTERVREIIAEVRANPRHEMKKLHEKIMSRGDQISREEFDQIKEWYPLTRLNVVQTFFEVASEIERGLRDLAGGSRTSKRRTKTTSTGTINTRGPCRIWRCLWVRIRASYVRKMLDAPQCPKAMYVMAYRLMNSCVSSLTARGAWLAGQIGKPMISHAKHAYQGAYDRWQSSIRAFADVDRTAHRKYRAEIGRHSLKTRKLTDPDPAKQVLQAMRSAIAQYFELACDTPEDFDRLLPSTGETALRDRGSHYPAGHPLAFGPDDPISSDLACALVMQLPLDMMSDKTANLHALCPVDALDRARIEQRLFLAEKYMNCLRSDWSPRLTMAMLKPLLDYRARPMPRSPRRSRPQNPNETPPARVGARRNTSAVAR